MQLISAFFDPKNHFSRFFFEVTRIFSKNMRFLAIFSIFFRIFCVLTLNSYISGPLWSFSIPIGLNGVHTSQVEACKRV